MSIVIIDSQEAGPAVLAAVAIDITGDLLVAATVVEAFPMSIAIDITGDLTSEAFTPFIAPETGCVRIAVITH